jgi:uncharacterized DUF497 family protein
MDISFDPAKNERNLLQRGIPFTLVAQFEWDSALMVEDRRKDYGERRMQALGFIEARLHMLVFTARRGTIHVISLRRANSREIKGYEAQTES